MIAKPAPWPLGPGQWARNLAPGPLGPAPRLPGSQALGPAAPLLGLGPWALGLGPWAPPPGESPNGD